MADGLERNARRDDEGRASKERPDRRSRKVGVILAAARALFLKHGFDTITMDMVTRESGVSKATLYVHFAGKEELFSAVMTEEARHVADDIWTTALENEDVAVVLRRVARNFVDIFLTEHALFFRRAVIGAIPRFPSIGRAVFDSGPKILTERLAQFLASANVLHVPDADLAARQFLSIVRGDMDIRGMLSMDLPTHAEIEAQIDTGIDMFLSFYSASRPARAP